MKSLTMLLVVSFATFAMSAAEARAAASKDSASSQSSELGTPVPGSASDQESTAKQRNPSKDQTTEQSSQMTLGGAKYVVTGEVLKVDDKYFFVKDAESGNEVRLVVNNDTHVICAPGQAGESSSIGKRSKGERDATEQQQAQGQRKDETAAGSGFHIGAKDCFKAGDKVKAEVSDMGTVTTLRYAAEDKSSDRAPMLKSAEGVGTPDMTDRSPKPEQLKKGAERATAPRDLREETSTESTQHAKADTSTAKECHDCEVVRGRVLKVENDYLTIRDRSKREVRLHLDTSTMIGQRNLKDEPFKEGDRVEAYVTPKGHAHSISLLRGQGGIPGDPDAGG